MIHVIDRLINPDSTEKSVEQWQPYNGKLSATGILHIYFDDILLQTTVAWALVVVPYTSHDDALIQEHELPGIFQMQIDVGWVLPWFVVLEWAELSTRVNPGPRSAALMWTRT